MIPLLVLFILYQILELAILCALLQNNGLDKKVTFILAIIMGIGVVSEIFLCTVF